MANPFCCLPSLRDTYWRNDINKATADFMLEQPWLSLFFYPYKQDCSADYVEQTEYDSDSENIREYKEDFAWIKKQTLLRLN